MKNKGLIIDVILLTVTVLVFGSLLVFGIYKSKTYVESVETTTTTTSREITTTTTYKYSQYETELAVFHGGSGEVTYNTYIYKIISGHANMGFKYRNETCITKTYGSSVSNCKDVGSGQFTWTDEAFIIAKKHGAYSYVTVPGEDKIYSIEKFAEKFMMD